MMEFRLSASMISCLICLRQINIDFHNTNFRLMGDYEKFDAVTIQPTLFKIHKTNEATGLQQDPAAPRRVYI